MIVVVAKLSLKPGKAEAMRSLARSLAGPSRGEDGNISYSCYEDALEPDTWFYFEEWASEPHLQAHFRSPHFAAAAGAFNELLAAAPAVKIYEVERSKDLQLA